MNILGFLFSIHSHVNPTSMETIRSDDEYADYCSSFPTLAMFLPLLKTKLVDVRRTLHLVDHEEPATSCRSV